MNERNTEERVTIDSDVRATAETNSNDSTTNPVSDAVAEGGGCCEAWEALSELRADDAESSTGRRGFLKRAASITGMSVAGVAALGNRVAAKDRQGVVKKVNGKPRRTYLAEALSDPEVKTLRKTFIQQGWTPNVGDATVTETDDPKEGEYYHSVLIPFRTHASDEEAYILWTNSDHAETMGQHSRRVEPEDAEAYWIITSYNVENGEVTTEREQVKNFLGCSNVNVGCVLVIASSYAFLFSECAACAGSSGVLVPACAGCIGAVLGWAGAITICDWCRD